MVKVVHTEDLSAYDTESEELHKVINKRKKKQMKKVKIVKEDDIDNMLTSSNEDTITTEEYFKQVHEFFKTQNKKNPKTKNRMKEYIYEKMCEVCKDIRDDHLLLLCDYCDDAYHTYCLEPKLNEVPQEEIWCCPECFKEKKEKCLENDGNTQLTCVMIQGLSNEENSGINPSTSTKKNQRQTTLDEHYEMIKQENERQFVKLRVNGVFSYNLLTGLPKMQKKHQESE